MCGVIVVDAGRSRSTNLGRDAYIMDHCLDIVMIIYGSINYPTVICLPIALLFSWEKPLVKPTAPGSLLHHICFRDLFFIHFCFQIYWYKKPKILCCNFLSPFQSIISLSRDWQPLDRVVVRRFVFLCAGAVHGVFDDSPSGSITLVLNWGKYFSACYIIPSSSGKPPTWARAISTNK
jgi:hypothetical protein